MSVKHIFIVGKVQGVSFRYHAYEQAIALGVNGWIRNLSDGRVECVATSKNEAKLNEFIEWLKKGPSRAVVESFQISEASQPVLKHDVFYIRRDEGDTWSE